MTSIKNKLFVQYFLVIILSFTSSCVSANLIDIGKKNRMWVEQCGTGKPAIILMNGGGDTIDSDWKKIIPKLCKITSVVAYDRPGQIKSPGKKDLVTPRTAKDVVDELRRLLSILQIKPPYVLVVHSISGLYGQYYARNFPKEIAGLIMINGNLVSEQFPETIKWLSPKMLNFIKLENSKHIKKLKMQLNETVRNLSDNPTTKQLAQIEYSLEVLGKKESAMQVMNSPPLSKNLTLAVLTSGKFDVETRIQKEFSEQIPGAIFKEFPNSSHYIQNDQPEAVIGIINEVIAKVRKAPIK